MTGRPRKLTGERLAMAQEWYARYLAIPSAAEMARSLGVSTQTLFNSVQERRAEIYLRRKCRAAGVQYESPPVKP